MDLKTTGIIFLICLVILQVIGWIFSHDGILTGAIMGIIGLIAGSLFGFEYKIFKDKKQS